VRVHVGRYVILCVVYAGVCTWTALFMQAVGLC